MAVVQLSMVRGTGTGKTVSIASRPGQRTLVGRSTDAAIVIDDPCVSRQHFEFVDCEGHVVLRDLQSRNGTLVNGQRVRDRLLRRGDLITLGLTQLEVVALHAGSGSGDACPSNLRCITAL